MEQKLDDRQFLDLLHPLETELNGRLPTPGKYVLSVGARAVRGATRAEEIRKLLADWITNTAPTLAIGSPQTAPRHFCQATVPGVPFEVILYRWGHGEGQLQIARHTSTLSLPRERRRRILTAFARKCEKLHDTSEAQAVAGFPCESILVLESNDIALTNPSVVSHATVAGIRWMQMRCPQHMPNHVILVDTCIEKWTAWVVKEHKTLFPFFNHGLSITGINPQALSLPLFDTGDGER